MVVVVLASSDGRQIVSSRHDMTQVNMTRHGRIFVVFMRHRDMLMLNTPTSFEYAVSLECGLMVGNVAIRKTYP